MLFECKLGNQNVAKPVCPVIGRCQVQGRLQLTRDPDKDKWQRNIYDWMETFIKYAYVIVSKQYSIAQISIFGCVGELVPPDPDMG